MVFCKRKCCDATDLHTLARRRRNKKAGCAFRRLLRRCKRTARHGGFELELRYSDIPGCCQCLRWSPVVRRYLVMRLRAQGFQVEEKEYHMVINW